jgi:hypothetical protein
MAFDVDQLRHLADSNSDLYGAERDVLRQAIAEVERLRAAVAAEQEQLGRAVDKVIATEAKVAELVKQLQDQERRLEQTLICPTCGASQRECFNRGHNPGCTYPATGVHVENFQQLPVILDRALAAEAKCAELEKELADLGISEGKMQTLLDLSRQRTAEWRRAEAAEAQAQKYRKALETIVEMECTDGNCQWRGHPAAGMHTNGGCNCFGERSTLKKNAAVKALARAALTDSPESVKHET